MRPNWFRTRWFAVVGLVVGLPSLLDNAYAWLEILGMSVLATISLMMLTAHFTAVAFTDGEPYKSWWQRLRPRRRVKVLHTHGNAPPWHESRVALGNVHCLQFEDEGLSNCIEIDKRYRIAFTHPLTDHFWGESTEGEVRRYESGPFAEGHGLRNVLIVVKRDDQ